MSNYFRYNRLLSIKKDNPIIMYFLRNQKKLISTKYKKKYRNEKSTN